MKAYKLSEVANILQVTTRTVTNEINRNKLKCFYVGSDRRVSEQQLCEYMKIVKNDYKTEEEVILEKENNQLKEQLKTAQLKLLKISQVFLEDTHIKQNENEKLMVSSR
ncbi:helix-turn-helix domain-containing protein [Clostridium sp. 001]|uniref:helix-turn-helix domain-containing protein n=1 Tax=Clostridium sp. 001 TaxID=1970093 RepID=UPI001C2CB47D|nr:helix-turn-helix domain-containing protein [Clostridium sp. 001]QXE19979.1 hypothetical protein B5S50_14745 [Clostridium sp. 001]